MSRATAFTGTGKKTDNLQAQFTPPWAARVLCEWLASDLDPGTTSVFDPAAGQGHLLHGLQDYYTAAHGDDLFDHEPRNYTPTLNDYIANPPGFAGHVVTNPPYRDFDAFAKAAMSSNASLVALLMRLQVLGGAQRSQSLWLETPPNYLLFLPQRPHMQPGPPPATGGKSTMDYLWIVWDRKRPLRAGASPSASWLPPDRVRLTRPGDYFNTQPHKYQGYAEA